MRCNSVCVFLFLTILTLVGFPASAQIAEISVDVTPSVIVPLGASTDLYKVGGGVTLAGRVPLGSVPLYLGAGLSFGVVPTLAPNLAVSLISGGVGAGTLLRPFEWLEVDLGVRGGGYLSVYSGVLGGNPQITAYFAASGRITPAISVGIGAGYDYLTDFPGGQLAPFLTSLSASITASITPGNFASGGRTPRIEIDPPQFDRVFPVFYRYYNTTPLGSVSIRNDERHAIEDVTVSFFVEQYMSAPKVSEVIDRMEPGESRTVSLYALFTEDILGITESTDSQAQVIVEYVVDETSLTADRVETLKMQNRNQMTWDDDRKAAAFVTAGDPTVLRFSRNTTAAIRETGDVAIDERLRTAMAVFEALGIYGLAYVIDPDSSYVELSQDETTLDTLQFPVQTLDYQGGDCDDLSILYASLLEAIGIPTAFITIPGHIYMAFELGLSEDEALRTLSVPDDLIFHDGGVWLPVETTLIDDGFLQAWSTGARQWRENDRRGVAELLPIRSAWVTYKPTGFSSDAIQIVIPGPDDIALAYDQRLSQLVDRELLPQVESLRDRTAQSGGSPRLVNRLGALFARYGRYDEAVTEFESIVRDEEYAPALVNLGNISFLRGDFYGAFRYFTRALAERPGDPVILMSLARAHFEREEYTSATERYREAEVMDPDLAERFAYVVSESTEAGRASDARDRDPVLWSEE